MQKTMDEGFKRRNINVAEYIRKGLLDSETFAAKSEPKDLFKLMRKEEIDDLMSAFSVKRLHYVASDGPALLLREEIDAMDDETFQLYLKYHFVVCEREDLVGKDSLFRAGKERTCPLRADKMKGKRGR